MLMTGIEIATARLSPMSLGNVTKLQEQKFVAGQICSKNCMGESENHGLSSFVSHPRVLWKATRIMRFEDTLIFI